MMRITVSAMNRSHVMTITLTTVGLLAGSMLLSASTQASPTSTPGTINACYDTTTGALRLTPNRAEKGCLDGEKRVRWAEQGQRGPRGARGRDGADAGRTEVVRWTFEAPAGPESSVKTDTVISGPARLTGVAVVVAPESEPILDRDCPDAEFFFNAGELSVGYLRRGPQALGPFGQSVDINLGGTTRITGVLRCRDLSGNTIDAPDGVSADLDLQVVRPVRYAPEDVTAID